MINGIVKPSESEIQIRQIMKPELLPLPSSAKSSLLHQHGIIFRQYRFNEDEYYFCLHPEPFPLGDSIDYTGRYLVILFSIKGIETFYITPAPDDQYIIATEDDEADYSTQNADAAIEEIKGIHLATETTITHNEVVEKEDDEDEGEDDFGYVDDDKPFVDYLTFDSPATLLALINEAIRESKHS